jgi:phosphatidylinositol glycan class T
MLTWGSDERWTAITHALGGLFCAGLGPDAEESIKTFGHIYPPETNIATNLTHRLMSTPYLPLCTENLTPFLSLLPSKGLSGLSTLLAQPNIVFSWGFKTEGIEVIMPSLENGGEGRWRGWWEGVVDLVPEKQGGGSRSFSLGSLFKRGVPRPFPEASTSVLRLIKSGGEEVSVEPDNEEVVWMDGKEREVVEWDLLGERVQSKDIKVDWVNEEVFRYRKSIQLIITVLFCTMPCTDRQPGPSPHHP